MNELHKAYQALGLEPGTAFDTIKRRYRRLALVWHPDRMSSADAKREAEEELKKINNTFEKLKKHFESEHKSGPSCRCQPATACPPPNSSQNKSTNQNNNSSSSTGPSEAERKRQEEEATRKRTAEREKKEAEAEAARRATQAAQSAQQNQQAADEAIKSEALRKEEVLRWKCTLLVAITFVALIGYCWIGCAARDLVHWTGRQWDEFQSQFKPKNQQPSPPSYTLPKSSPPVQRYIPPYERSPARNPSSWQQYIEDITTTREQDSTWPFAPPAPPPNN